MAEYRVRQGYRFGAQNQHKAGDVVELSEAHAVPFLDKLELVVIQESQPIPVGDIDGMKAEWAEALIELGVADSDAFKAAEPDTITGVDGIGAAKYQKLLDACP